MDSRVAIAKGIADLDCEPEVRACLSAILNLELMSSLGSPVSQTSYLREVDQKFTEWQPLESRDTE